jgi:phage portal protein BeeE
MNVIQKSLDRATGIATTAHRQALQLKSTGELSAVTGDMGSYSWEAQRDQRANYERYGLYRGWLYAAIHATCLEAAGQPAYVGRLLDALPMEEDTRRRIGRTKHMAEKMPKGLREKSIREGFELVQEHPLVDLIERPNPIQSRWQFTYMFVAQLNLTGWGYLVGGLTGKDGQMEIYSVPTTWITPDHREGPFAKFKFKDPKITGEGIDLTREQVGIAYIPNPANMLTALSPTRTQIEAVRIDDHIQASQERFFENGIFPSMVLTIGDNPLGQGGGGGSPLLTGPQRRAIVGAIHKRMGGVANSGEPLILDGLVSKAERLSATQTEMGWEKSEEKVKTRILSSFGVHPFILGEAINVGGYAQASIIKSVFCDRVNSYLSMLSLIMTNRFAPQMSETERLTVWWEECVPADPELERKYYEMGRKTGDVTRDEYRAKMGLPPLEVAAERNKLLETVGGMTGAVQILNAMGMGSITSETAAKLLALFFEIEEKVANDIIGVGRESIPMAIDQLEAAVRLMKEPVKVEVEDGVVQKTVDKILSASSNAARIAEEAKEEVKDVRKKADELHFRLATETVKYGMEARGLSEAVMGTRDQMSRDVKVAIEKLSSHLATITIFQAQSDMGETIKTTLDALAEKLGKSLDTVEESVKQPINVQVTNEVNPTPIVNEVNPAEVKVHNEIPETQVDVRNVVETPKVEVQVDAPAVTVEAPEVKVEGPTVNVAAPEVKVEPTIEVEPADVKVEICKDGKKPRRAIITHPDGKISQVELED